MAQDRWGIIYSPKVGVRRSHKRWEKIRTYLEEKQVTYDFVQSEGVGSVERLTDMLITNGYNTIVIVGGDAALNEALNGLMKAGEDALQRIVLGVIPNGFGNNFATFWGMDEDDYRSCVDNLIRRRIRLVDVGRCLYQSEQGTDCGRYFLNAVNIGLGASIIGITDEARKYIGVKFFAHILTSIRLLFARKLYKVKAVVNFEVLEENMVAMCVGSALGYGQTPNAVPYNGMLDVSVVGSPKNLKQMIHGLYLLMVGKFLNYKKMRPYRTRVVDVEVANRARISVDGQVFKEIKAPLHITIKQEQVQFIIPSRKD